MATAGMVTKAIVTTGAITKGMVTKGIVTKGMVTKGMATKGVVTKGMVTTGMLAKGINLNLNLLVLPSQQTHSDIRHGRHRADLERHDRSACAHPQSVRRQHPQEARRHSRRCWGT